MVFVQLKVASTPAPAGSSRLQTKECEYENSIPRETILDFARNKTRNCQEAIAVQHDENNVVPNSCSAKRNPLGLLAGYNVRGFESA